MRAIRLLALLLLLTPSWAATVATLTLTGGPDQFNQVTQCATAAAEASVVVTLTPESKRTIMMVCDQDWKYRSTTATSTTDLAVAAGQVLTLTFQRTTTFYILRTTVDGTLKIVPLY